MATANYNLAALSSAAGETDRGRRLIGARSQDKAFIDRCVDSGIAHPAGTILQDMGWAGRPWRLGMSQQVVSMMRHVTWREYVDTIASPPVKQWKASQEDLRVGLPWGGVVLQRIAQLVRLSENRLIQAEKLAAMAFMCIAAGQFAWPRAEPGLEGPALVATP